MGDAQRSLAPVTMELATLEGADLAEAEGMLLSHVTTRAELDRWQRKNC